MKQKLLFPALALGAFLFTGNSAKAQNGINLDGTDDYMTTTLPAVSGNTAKTIEAWIKTTTISDPGAGGAQRVIADMGSATSGGRFTMNLLYSNSIRVESGSGGVSGTVAVNDGNWHHVAVTYDPTAVSTARGKVYVDGNLITQGSITVSTGTANTFQIGKRVDNINYFPGSIDEVRVWNVARSAADIMANKNVEFCSPQTGLVGYYKFNNGAAAGTNSGLTSVTDYSGNNRTGTLNGFALTGATSNIVSGATLTLTSIDNSVTANSNLLTATETGSGVSYQWIDCDNGNTPIPNETNQSYTATATGNYAVQINKNGCKITSNCYAVSTLSASQFNSDSNIRVYPNPSLGNFMFHLGANQEKVTLTVKNITGQTILRKEFGNTADFSISLEESTGIYFATIETASGETSTHKLIKR